MTIAIVIAIIGLLILVHEAGHYLAARAAGIPVETFSIGFGPALWKRRIGATEFRFSLVPLGGYVMPAVADEAAWFALSPAKRVVFSLGGPAANIVFTAVLIAAINALSTPTLHGLFVAPWIQTAALFGNIIAAIPALFTGPESLSGIVGIVAHGQSFIGGNPARALQFAAVIGMNLAVLNLLPLPALDGGKIILSTLELATPRARRLQVPLTVISWIFLIAVMIAATVNDVVRLAV